MTLSRFGPDHEEEAQEGGKLASSQYLQWRGAML